MHVMDEQEQKLLDHIGTPIFVLEVNDTGVPIYVAFNRAACGATGMNAQDVVGKTAKTIYPGRMGEIAYDRHVEASRRKQPYTYELWLPLEGQRRCVRTTLDPVLDESGKVVRLIGTSADISAEQTVREAQANSVTLHSEIEERGHPYFRYPQPCARHQCDGQRNGVRLRCVVRRHPGDVGPNRPARGADR